MPKSRGRGSRRRRQPHGHRGGAAPGQQRGWSSPEAAAYLPHVRVLQEVNARERAGDAAGALDLMERFLHGPDGKPFWAWWRAERLVQIDAMRELLPGWALSRWVAAQALIHLDSRTRVIHTKALAAACRAGGRPELAGATGLEHRASQCAVMDHDWVYRQTFLYDFGGLAHFLSRGGLAPAVRRSADAINEWTRAPVGAFRLVEVASRTITWTDVSSGEEIRAINLGSAACLAPGGYVIGRLVPSEDGRLFESPPLPVDESLADAVGSDPSAWLDALTDSGPTSTVAMPGDLSQLLTDVPSQVWRALAEDHSSVLTDRFGDPDPLGVFITTEELDQMAADLVLAAVEGRVEAADVLDPWPCVAAAATAADVWPRVVAGLSRHQAAAVASLGERLSGPAAELCWRTARVLRSTA